MNGLDFKKLVLAPFLAFALSCNLACAAEWVVPGPAVGASFPNELKLNDQSGAPQSLQSLAGTKGTAIFFVRSADWCPFCKRQLAEVNGRTEEFKKLGYNVVSVSHDTVELIAAFHAAQKISFRMLADPDGAVVESLKIRDLQYADGSKAFGVARPMIFIVNRQRSITHKFAEESFRNRPNLDTVLATLAASAKSP
jgi:peroxiredoxin